MTAKGVVLSFILICWMGNAVARQPLTTILPKGTFFLRVNPLGLIDLIEQSISTGAEYRFNPKWSAAIDLAYIFHTTHSMQIEQSTNGYIIRPAVRKYFSRQLNHYVEAELHYKYMANSIEDWVGRDAVNGTPSYEEYKKFKLIKQMAGVQFKMGAQECLVRQKWLWIELYLGFGIRKKWQDTDLPADAAYTIRRPVRISSDPNQDNTITPAFPAGVRLLFKIK